MKYTQGELTHQPATDFQHSPTLLIGNLKIATVWMGQAHPINVDAHIHIPGEANAARIALCWNMHDRLVSALDLLMKNHKLILMNRLHYTSGEVDEMLVHQDSRALLAEIDGAK